MSIEVSAHPATGRIKPDKASRPARWVVKQGRWGYLMVAASTLGLALFQLGPMVWAMTESVRKFNPITHKAVGFVGLDNFRSMMADPSFWLAFQNTFIYCIVTATVELALGLGIALLLDRALPATPIARTAVVAALAVSDSVASLLWSSLLDKDIGPVNGLLSIVGIEPVGWLTSAPAAMISVMVVTIWRDVGLIVLIYLAGLQGLDDELFNAAAVDGANSWQQFRYVTLPGLRRVSVLAIFVVTITGLRIFTPINLMTLGGPNGSSQNLIYYIYDQSMKNLDYGIGSAATLFLVVVMIIVTVAQGAAMRERDTP
nr:sugar ABC transporter permease [Propionicimonas sp.]